MNINNIKSVRVIIFSNNPANNGFIEDIYEADIGLNKSGKFPSFLQSVFISAIEGLDDNKYIVLQGINKED